MKRIAVLLIVFVLVATACDIVEETLGLEPADTAPDVFQISERKVIFSGEYTKEQKFLSWVYGAPIDDFWTPRVIEHVDLLDAALPDYLRSLLPDYPDAYRIEEILEGLDEYYVQYMGLVIEGERYVFANYACNVYEGWQDELIVVMDGGSCFFSVFYNPNIDEFSRLSINGEA